MVVFYRGGWVCVRWCPDGHILHLCVHLLNVGFVGGVDPFLGRLSDFILYLPLGGLGFAACSDVFNVCHDTVHGQGLTAVRGWALGSVVTWLVTFEIGNCCHVAGISAVIRWGRV